MIPHRLFLYTVRTCQGILKNTDLRCDKGKYHKEYGQHTKRCDGQFGGPTSYFVSVKETSFVYIGNGGTDKENGDVEPIGGFADHAVIGVKDDGYQSNSHKSSSELDTPKNFAISEEKTLYDGEDKHGPKE